MKELKFVLPPVEFKRLFFDIETSYEIGKFWRPSFKAVIRHDAVMVDTRIICISYKWEGKKDIHSLRWNKGCDKELLTKFMRIAEKADEIVAHNGDNFDEKIIRTRCLFNGLDCPPKFQTLDTLKKARKHFRFDSNSLEYISKKLTGAGKTPMCMQDWDDICIPLIPRLLCGIVTPLPKSYRTAMDKMVKYCEVDIERLEEVFHKLQPYIEHNHHAGAKAGFGRWSCPDCAHDNPHIDKQYHLKAGTLRYSLCCGDPKCRKRYVVSPMVWRQKLEADYKVSQALKT